MKGELRISLNGPQSKAWRALRPGNTVAIPWGRGVGKSWFIRIVCYLLVTEWDGKVRPGADGPGVRIVFLLPTMEQFRKVHLSHLIRELDGSWKALGGVVNKTMLRVEFPGGSWIQVVSAEAAEGSRGIRCDVVLPDEADDIDPEIVESITQPWFTEPHSLRITLIGGTPKRGRHGLLYRAHKYWPDPEWWVAQLGDPAQAKRHISVHATCYDAPKHVDRDYIDNKVRPKTAPAVFKREYLCDFDSAEGLIYPMFSPDFHVRSPRKGIIWSEIIIGVDHGYEDPAVFLVCGVQGSGRDATVWVIEEFCEIHKVPTELQAKAKALKVKYSRFKQTWFADPSRPEAIEEYRRAGIHIEPAMNAIEDGIGSVADRMAVREREPVDGAKPERYARLYIDPSCKSTIAEIGLYRRKRDPRNPERILDAPLGKDDHCCDALKYAIFTRFGGAEHKRIERTGFSYG